MRGGARVLLFKQGLPGDPVAIVPVGSLIAVASSDGTITYMDSKAALRTLSICSGRLVKMAHGTTSRGGVIYAICYSREKQVASLAIIMDSGGFRFYEQPVPSKVQFLWDGLHILQHEEGLPSRSRASGTSGS